MTDQEYKALEARVNDAALALHEIRQRQAAIELVDNPKTKVKIAFNGTEIVNSYHFSLDDAALRQFIRTRCQHEIATFKDKLTEM